MTEAALHGITRALASVGRAFICLDSSFTIRHASHLLDRYLGDGAAKVLCGRPVEELLGSELFGSHGLLREALLSGQMREGWRATLNFNSAAPQLVSITTAPLAYDNSDICDPMVRYLILLRAMDEEETCSSAPVYYSGAIACSSAMLRIFRMAETLQQSEATVLITGESGTGKEVVARAIHHRSTRSSGPFVAVNCGAIPADLLEAVNPPKLPDREVAGAQGRGLVEGLD
jgi:transcriptional regulator of acetoin/glycerol metabolism